MYDLAVIGAGSAGLSVAAAAAQFGSKVVLFEKSDMGGDCLNSGCVPSKALLAAAKAAQAQRDAAAFGIEQQEPVVDFAKVMAHVQQVIGQIAPHDSQERFEGLGVSVVRGAARFTSADTIDANGTSYTARRFVIATGSRAAVPPIPGLSDVPFLTNENVFHNHTLPTHLVVIGGGPIGLEMAQAHRRLGAKVTVLEGQRCLAKDDPELSAVVLARLRADGVDIREGVKIERLETSGQGVNVFVSGVVLQASHVLVAAGRRPNLEELGLEQANILHDKRGIVVDKGLRSTSNRRVYAAGDVAGGLQFTHVAGFHAGLIIRNALFRLPVNHTTTPIPWVTYTDPELAQIGLTEAEARAAHGDGISVQRFSFDRNDRAVAEHKTQGLVKVVASKRGKLLGVGIAGPVAGEQLAMWTLALSRGLSLSAIAGLVLPYPTLSEAGKRAAVGHYAGFASKPWLRKLITFLGRFG